MFKKIITTMLLGVVLIVGAFAQTTVHTPTLERNNTWTGTNTFSGTVTLSTPLGGNLNLGGFTLSNGVINPTGGTLSGNYAGNPNFTGTPVFLNSPTFPNPLVIPGNVSFGGGTPWFDVTAFGAKCDNGTTDNTTPIQNAWNAAKTTGSGAFVYFPPCSGDYLFNSPLNFSSSNGIRFGSLGGGTATLASPRIVYTGTTSPAINCQTPIGLIFQNMAIMYNNPAFSGTLMDCSSASTGAMLRLDNVQLAGFSTAKLATNLLLATNCQKCGVYNGSTFAWAVNGINSLGGNVLTVENSQFGSSGPLSGAALLNTTAGSHITGNNFEFINAPNTSSAFDSSVAGCFGCAFEGNWLGDMPVGWTGTVIKGATSGMLFAGNTFQGVATGTMLTINGGQLGFAFIGNDVQGPWGTLFTSNAAVANILISGNHYSGSITNFYTGAGSTPLSGMIVDNSGNTTTYSQSIPPVVSAPSFPGMRFFGQGGAVDTKIWDLLGTSNQFIFRHVNDALNAVANVFLVDNTGNVINDFNIVPPLDYTEQTAPSGRAGFTRCYGDSTAHALECSYNNDAFAPVPRTAVPLLISGTPTAGQGIVATGTNAASWQTIGGSFSCVNVTPVTVNANVTTDQTLMACTIPANTLNVVGKTLSIQGAGVYSTPAASSTTVNVKVKLCTVSGCGSGTVINLVSITSAALGAIQATNDPFNFQIFVSTQTAGASAAFETHGNLTIDTAALTTAAEGVYADGNTATVGTINSTAQLFLQITGAFSAASASNSMTNRQLTTESFN